MDLSSTQKYIDMAIEMAIQYGPKLVLAIVVLIVGNMVIGGLVGAIRSAMTAQKFDESLQPFLVGLVRTLLKVMLLISVAQMVGIETTSFIAVIGAAGLAIGMALQGSLGNFAGGVLILILRPFNKGDYIVAQGEEGVVQRIDVFATTILRPDNQMVIIPNGPLSGGLIKNVTGEDTRRVDLAIGVGYDDDVDKACKVLEEACKAHSKVLSDPAPFVGITDYGDSSINLTVRPWCKTSDYWDVFFEVNAAMKPALDKAGISIPFPQRDVHIHNQK